MNDIKRYQAINQIESSFDNVSITQDWFSVPTGVKTFVCSLTKDYNYSYSGNLGRSIGYNFWLSLQRYHKKNT